MFEKTSKSRPGRTPPQKNKTKNTLLILLLLLLTCDAFPDSVGKQEQIPRSLAGPVPPPISSSAREQQRPLPVARGILRVAERRDGRGEPRRDGKVNRGQQGEPRRRGGCSRGGRGRCRREGRRGQVGEEGGESGEGESGRRRRRRTSGRKRAVAAAISLYPLCLERRERCSALHCARAWTRERSHLR